MNKQEFVEQLRRSLSSINDYTFVNDTISYYENYIESQIRMGKSEEEVMRQLGDPRLIAKSIQATHVDEEGEQEEYHEYGTYRSRNDRSMIHVNGRQINIPSWMIKILTIVFVCVVLFLAFTILRWLAPFIFMGVFVYMILKMFVGRSG